MWKEAWIWRWAVTSFSIIDMMVSMGCLFFSACGVYESHRFKELEIQLPDSTADAFLAVHQCCLIFCSFYTVQIWAAFRLLLAAQQMDSDRRGCLRRAMVCQRVNLLQILVMIPFWLNGLNLNFFVFTRMIFSVLVQIFVWKITKVINDDISG